jgi:hypothetical protein
MNTLTKKLIERVASWPKEDIAKLAEAVSAIESWRNGEHHTSEDSMHYKNLGAYCRPPPWLAKIKDPYRQMKKLAPVRKDRGQRRKKG